MGILSSTPIKSGKFSLIILLRILDKRLRVGGGGESTRNFCNSPREGGWVKRKTQILISKLTPPRSKPSIDLLPKSLYHFLCSQNRQSKFWLFLCPEMFFCECRGPVSGCMLKLKNHSPCILPCTMQSYVNVIHLSTGYLS